MKASGEKITMLTSYDYSARLVDAAGIDVILLRFTSNVMQVMKQQFQLH